MLKITSPSSFVYDEVLVLLKPSFAMGKTSKKQPAADEQKKLMPVKKCEMILLAKMSLVYHTLDFIYEHYQKFLQQSKFGSGKPHQNGYWNLSMKTFQLVKCIQPLLKEVTEFMRATNACGRYIVTTRSQVYYIELTKYRIKSKATPSNPLFPLVHTLLVHVLWKLFPRHLAVDVTLLENQTGITKNNWKLSYPHGDFTAVEGIDDEADAPVVIEIPLREAMSLEMSSLYKFKNTYKHETKPKHSPRKFVTCRLGGMIVMTANQFHSTGNPFLADPTMTKTRLCSRLHFTMATQDSHLTAQKQQIDLNQNSFQVDDQFAADFEEMMGLKE